MSSSLLTSVAKRLSSASRTLLLLSSVRSSTASTSSSHIDPVQESLLEERCILVDEDDRPTGSASKRECHYLKTPKAAQLPLHRAFSLFLFDGDGRLLLQKRSAAKVTFPKMWSNTCCSHPLSTIAPETEETQSLGVKRAAKRKVLDELGIRDCQVKDMTAVARILYSAESPNIDSTWGEHELDHVLLLKSSRPIVVDPNPNEVSEIAWVAKNEMSDFVEKHDEKNFTPWFKLISESLLPSWWDDLDRLEELREVADRERQILRF